jgi:hypothetical protein
MYEYLRTFFRDTTENPFRVFVRVLPGQDGYPATALRSSFMLGTPPGSGDPKVSAPRETLTYEMVRHWVGGIDGPEGTMTWFSQGLAMYYARLLPMKAGMDSAGSFLRSVNNTARGYYTNPSRSLPNVRGSLYFADVDAKLRTASGGRRRLEDILFPIFARVRQGEHVTPNDFVDALIRELGPSARQQFEAVIVRGETFAPAPSAFGPCFDRKPATFTVEGKTVDGYQWVRVASVPDGQC